MYLPDSAQTRLNCYLVVHATAKIPSSCEDSLKHMSILEQRSRFDCNLGSAKDENGEYTF